MERQSPKDSVSANSSSVVKPVPLYYYVDQFERLYQQSPMAKMFRQGTQSATPKGLKPRDGQSRNSTTAKSFRLPLPSSENAPANARVAREDSLSTAQGEVELNVQARTGTGSETGECILTRRDDDDVILSGASDLNSSVGKTPRGSDTSCDQVEIAGSEIALRSPRCRLQGPPRWNSERKKPSNLHNLIQRLASPAQKGSSAANDGRPAKGNITDTTPAPPITGHDREGESDTQDGGAASNMQPRRGVTDWDSDNVCDTPPRDSDHEAEGAGWDDREGGVSLSEKGGCSGATKRTSPRKLRSQSKPDQVSILSQNHMPVPGGRVSRRKSVPQRRLLQDLHLATSQDRADWSPNASEQNNQYQMRPVCIPPNNTKPTKSGSSHAQYDATPLSSGAPVNRRMGTMRVGAKGSRCHVGGLIRSLQAGQQLEQNSPRSEIPYSAMVDNSTQEDDETERLDDSPMKDADNTVEEPVPGEENGEEKEEERDIQDAERTPNEIQVNDEITNTTSYRDSTEMEHDGKTTMDEQTEEETNRQPRENKQNADTPEESSTSQDTPKIPKETSETIINKWIIKPVLSCKGVCVEGHRVGDRGDQFWHSTAIMVRIGPRLLATKSGSLYRLAGKMDRALTMEQGFSESVVRSFQKGFPPSWRELIHDHYASQDVKKTQESTSKVRNKKTSIGVSPMPGHAEHAVTDSLRKEKKKNPVTPQNLRVKDLQRSSSGRLIKPPLAYWTGQRVRHNTSLDVVEILRGSEDRTSASAYQISLQDSLEIGPREERAIKRSTKGNKFQNSTREWRHKRRIGREDTDAGKDSSSCLDEDTETERGDSESLKDKRRLSKDVNKRYRIDNGIKESAMKRRMRSTITESSDGKDVPKRKVVPGSKTEDGSDPSISKVRGNSRYLRRKLRNGKYEEPRTGTSVEETCSSDHPGLGPLELTTDDSVNTSPANPLISSRDDAPRQSHKNNQAVVMHTSSQLHRGKQPPPPQKVRLRKHAGKASMQDHSRAPVSPLYYQFSPDSEEDATCGGPQPAVGKTPSGGQRSNIETSTSTVGQSSLDPGQSSEGSLAGVMSAERESKRSSEKAGSRGSLGTLNLEEEILAVVEKHKQGRIARMRERSMRLSASSRDKIQRGSSPSTSEVYDLSDEEAKPGPTRVPYLPPGTSNSTTTGESVSNWSEEGDKSVNKTWVTRTKPYRRIYGTLEDPSYRTDETTTETTTVSTSESPLTPVNLQTSDTEATITESSAVKGGLRSHTANQKKSLSTGPKGARSKNVQDVDTPTSDNEQAHLHNNPRGSKRTKRSNASSSEDTDDTLRPKDKTVRRGRSKKAVIVQRHQPMRNCKKSESDSETNNPPKTTQNPTREGRTQPTHLHQEDASRKRRQVTVPEPGSREEMGSKRKQQGYPGTTSQVAQRMRQGDSRGVEADERQIKEASRWEENGDADFRTDKDKHQKEELDRPQSATKSTATKSTKQQVKEQENQAKTVVALTAKVGTLKRKRQLRDLVEQHNRGYEDDIFDSTPFKKQKKLKIPLGEWDIEEDTQEAPAGKTPGSARFKTPSVRYQAVMPLSDKKTPYSNLISPGLMPNVDRRYIDQYINGLQKKKGRGLMQRAPTAKKPTTAGRGTAKSGSATLTKVMNERVTEIFDVTPVSDSDPDEDRDYYWSDEEH